MGLITNEQKERRPGQFIKLEDKAIVALYSNLYKTTTHYIKSKSTSVICKGDECYFCQMGLKPRTNYFYYGSVSDEDGVLQMPASVFFAINEQERVLDMDKRESLWVISKSGSGKNTKYGVARGKDAGKSPIEQEEANDLLVKVCDSFVKNNTQRYEELSSEKIIETPDIDELLDEE